MSRIFREEGPESLRWTQLPSQEVLPRVSQVSLPMAITFSGPWYCNRGGAGVRLIARDYYYQETLSATVRGPTPTVSLAVVLSMQRVWWEVDLSLFSGALQALGGWV